MVNDGWVGGITNVDFSPVVIAQMKEKYKRVYSEGSFPGTPKMDFICADMTKTLPFETDSFDLIICKGSFDAVLTSCKASIQGVVSEAHRVLTSGHGVFFLVTNGNPDSRLEYLEHKYELGYYWQGVSVHPVPVEGVPKTKNDKYVLLEQGMQYWRSDLHVYSQFLLFYV